MGGILGSWILRRVKLSGAWKRRAVANHQGSGCYSPRKRPGLKASPPLGDMWGRGGEPGAGPSVMAVTRPFTSLSTCTSKECRPFRSPAGTAPPGYGLRTAFHLWFQNVSPLAQHPDLPHILLFFPNLSARLWDQTAVVCSHPPSE